MNNIITLEDHSIIYTTKGEEILIDTEDIEKIRDITWFLSKSYKNVYVRGWDKESRKLVYLHRYLLGVNNKLQVDHEDRNTCNNRKKNLRLATNTQNRCNIPVRKDSASGYKGVNYNKKSGKYRALITVNHKTKHLGMFGTAEEAAQAFKEAALFYYGEFAYHQEL